MAESKGNAPASKLDVYYAYLENGELVLEPYCCCGTALDESYRCERCQRHVHPTDILCEDTGTLNMVEKYMRTSPKFRNFRAMLGKRVRNT